jgi:hypothetical protein
LAEHRLCKAGVRGSIPLVSTDGCPGLWPGHPSFRGCEIRLAGVDPLILASALGRYLSSFAHDSASDLVHLLRGQHRSDVVFNVRTCGTTWPGRHGDGMYWSTIGLPPAVGRLDEARPPDWRLRRAGPGCVDGSGRIGRRGSGAGGMTTAGGVEAADVFLRAVDLEIEAVLTGSATDVTPLHHGTRTGTDGNDFEYVFQTRSKPNLARRSLIRSSTSRGRWERATAAVLPNGTAARGHYRSVRAAR